MSKPILNVVSLSGGKDSTCMLLMMIEKRMPVDLILFCDTGLEFPLMYEHLDKLEKTINMPITRVRADKPYEYYFLEAPVKRRHETEFSKKFGVNHKGYGWAGPKMRWCTSVLKDTPRERFLRPLREKYDVKEYIGIAADEQYRLTRKRNQNKNHIHPLVEWDMTEADCLKYCYDRGYDWGGLYEKFKRVSCWCCPLQSLPELLQLYFHFPDLWEKLKEWDRRTWRNFRADYSVEQLEVRFLFEQERTAAGFPLKGKEFYSKLRERLKVF
jgi:3'-phosphoadenosine 5'-phosphosulfate sulfotransferase (PAPS reductase)/FAD synthetase